MHTPFGGTDGVEEARERLLALGAQSSALKASFGGIEEASRAMRSICEQHAEESAKWRTGVDLAKNFAAINDGIGKVADLNGRIGRSFSGLHRIDEAKRAMLEQAADMDARIRDSFSGLRGFEEARRAMLSMCEQHAEESAKWRKAVHSVATNLDAMRDGMIPDISRLGMIDHSRILDDALNTNYALSSRIDDNIASLTPDLMDGLENPIYETNEKLEQVISMQVDIAKLHQSLNETTIAFLSEFRGVAQKTARQTRLIVAVALLTLIITGVDNWLNITSTNDITAANQRMLESLTDRIATIQSDMASQSADEREAMLADQNRLIEQLINATQALVAQQGIDQRAAIQELKEILNRKEAPAEEGVGPP